MTLSYSRRRPSRRLIWLLTIVTVVVFGFVLATTLRSERRVLAAYLDTAQRSAALGAAAGTEFNSLLTGLDQTDRSTFISSMNGIRQSAFEAAQLLEAAEVPDGAVAAHAPLAAAANSWTEGLDKFQAGVLDAADRPNSQIPEDVLREAIIDLAVGDDEYDAALSELMAVEAGADVEFTEYPAVAFVPSGVDWLTVAETARASEQLAVNIDVAVTALGLEPRILREEADGTGVLPFTERLIVGATVINQGNEPVTDVGVQVILEANRFGAGASEAVTIDRLDPAESTSLEYVFAVSPAVSYQLIVKAGALAGERNAANNRVDLAFFVNDEE